MSDNPGLKRKDALPQLLEIESLFPALYILLSLWCSISMKVTQAVALNQAPS